MSSCSEIGERELIRRISEILGGVENDDCAVIDAGDRYLVATTDMLHRQTDFPDIMNPWQMGWMSVAVNLSDIAAMGAEPSGILLATGLPPEADLYFIDELFSGLRGLCRLLRNEGPRRRHRLPPGADHHGLRPWLRGEGSDAAAAAARGWATCSAPPAPWGARERGLWAWKQGDLESEFIVKLLEPEPRLKEGRALAKAGR